MKKKNKPGRKPTLHRVKKSRERLRRKKKSRAIGEFKKVLSGDYLAKTRNL